MNTRTLTRIDSKSAAYMADPNWVGEQAASILDAANSMYPSSRGTAKLLGEMFIRGEYLDFCIRMKHQLQQRADEKAREDIDDEDSGIKARAA